MWWQQGDTTHLLVVLNVLILGEDPVDDDGQDADPLVLQPAKLVEDRVTELDQLADCRSLGNHALRSGLAGLREEQVDSLLGGYYLMGQVDSLI